MLQKLEIKPLLANGGKRGMRHRRKHGASTILLQKLFFISFHAKAFPQLAGGKGKRGVPRDAKNANMRR